MLSRHPSPPRLWLFYVGWGGCRVWGDVSVACGLARPDATLFWPRVSSPLLSRVPSCRVPARRFKDPGGVALPPPGSGGGGARREVGRSGGSPSDSMTLLPPLPPFPRRRSCGGVDVWSPLWAPVGARPAPPACPISAGRSCRCRSWVPVSFPCFSAPEKKKKKRKKCINDTEKLTAAVIPPAKHSRSCNYASTVISLGWFFGRAP